MSAMFKIVTVIIWYTIGYGMGINDVYYTVNKNMVVLNSAGIGKYTAGSRVHCAYMCLNALSCVSAEFHVLNKTCVLYHGVLEYGPADDDKTSLILGPGKPPDDKSQLIGECFFRQVQIGTSRKLANFSQSRFLEIICFAS